jgi:group I intron endonuclease
MLTTNIYVLIDPETDEVRYVGKANNVSERYKAHLNRARKHQIHKKNWIINLRNKGLKPIIEVIDIVPFSEWIFWEKYWISQMKTWGFNLINHTEGGDGCTFGNQTSFKKGSVPWNKGGNHTEESRVKMSKAQKNRIVTQETRDKMSDTRRHMTPSVKMINLRARSRKAVVQYNLFGKVVAEYDSIEAAAESMNSDPKSISSVCNGRVKTHKKFI